MKGPKSYPFSSCRKYTHTTVVLHINSDSAIIKVRLSKSLLVLLYMWPGLRKKACGHVNFSYFYNLSELINLYPNTLWQWNFQHLVWIIWHYDAGYKMKIFCSSTEIWPLERETGCSLCPHALFLQPCFCRPVHILSLCKFTLNELNNL